MKPVECRCIPDGHKVLTSDTSLLRRVRKDSLENANRWRESDPIAAVCADWTAYCCLVRLRELKSEGV